MPRRILVPALLLGSLLLNAIPLWWGVDATKSWAFDEPRPWQVLVPREWTTRYPPFYRVVAQTVLQPLEQLEVGPRLGWDEQRTHSFYLLVLRSLNVLLATATVYLVYRTGRRIGGWKAGWFAGLCLALSPTYVYYAKTANIDVPHLFFVAISILAAVRWIQERHAASAWVMALAAAAAIATKTPVYALFPLWPAAFLATVRWPARENVAPPRPHPLRDRQLWSACGIGAVALTLLLRLPWALDDLHRQAAATSSALAQRERDWPNTLAGHVGLFFDGLDRWGYVLSVPLALLSAAGLVLLIRRRELRAVGLLFALSALSYYGLFIAMIRFQPERYYLPLALMGAVAAGYALSRVSVRGRVGRAAATGAMVVIFGWAAARAVAVDTLMATDVRLQAERWLADRPDATPVLGVGRFQYLPRGIHNWDWDRIANERCGRLQELQQGLLVLSTEDGRDEGERNTRALLLDGHSGFTPVREFPRPAWSRRFIPLDATTNLDKISPAVTVLAGNAEACHDRHWVVQEAAQLLGRPQPLRVAALRDFLLDYWHPGLRVLAGERVRAGGVDPAGWSYGTAPVAVALANPSSRPWRPRLMLRGFGGSAEDPWPVRIFDGESRLLELDDPSWQPLAVPLLPPGGRHLILLQSERWGRPGPGSGKELGIRIRVAAPPEAR